jgi:hypothetical protein
MFEGMMTLNDLLKMIPFVLGLIIVWSGFNRIMTYFDQKENKKLIENFDHIHAILSFHMEGAYETIHKDNILVYSLDGVKPSEKDIDKISHEFVKLTLKLAGPNLVEMFVRLYGDDDTLYFVMLDYFNRKFEDDEIRTQAVDTIQNGEEL